VALASISGKEYDVRTICSSAVCTYLVQGACI